MKKLIAIVPLLLCLPVLGQNLQQYTGTWEASFQGKTFLTLRLVAHGKKLTGTVLHDDINVDANGDLTGIEPVGAQEKVTIVRRVGNGIDIYTHDDTEPNESGHYHMELTAPGQGKLQLVVLDPSAPKFKPWKVTRKKS